MVGDGGEAKFGWDGGGGEAMKIDRNRRRSRRLRSIVIWAGDV